MTRTIAHIPLGPGVYLFKTADGSIIYIGKAKSLRNRVRSYFRTSQTDWKVRSLLQDHKSIDYIRTKNEMSALLLEAELIQKYKPKYNVLLKTGQPFVYLLFTSPRNGTLPTLKIVRHKKEKGTYFGPFLYKTVARNVYRFLMRTFRLHTCNKHIENGCLDYHLDNCAGTCRKDFDQETYLFQLQLAQEVLKKNHDIYKEKLLKKIKQLSNEYAFEQAQRLNNYMHDIDTIFGTLQSQYKKNEYAIQEFVATTPSLDIIAETLEGTLQQFFNTDKPIRSIDCFDISHFQSRFIVGSCIRFTDGKPDKNKFRRFKINSLSEQNDYASLQEIIGRRYKDDIDLPDLVLIDGGRGQLSAAKVIIPHAFCASIAKREETVYCEQFPHGIKLDIKTDVGKLLIAIRDYAHHFAISYHRLRRSKNSTY